jgi:hypothetical protein
VNALDPAKSGLNPPPHNGHEWQLSSAPLATTVDPVKSSKYVATAPSAASLLL